MIGDSELIAKQVQGLYKVKHPAMRPLYLEAMAGPAGLRAAGRSEPCPRAQNADADALVNAALDQAAAARAERPPAERPGGQPGNAQCSGCADLAIASICEFDSSSSSVLVSQ